MKFYGKRRNYAKKQNATKKRTTKKRVVSTNIKSYVNRAISRNIEDKITNWTYTGSLYQFNSTFSAWFTYNYFIISPNLSTLNLSQNAFQGGRIGNEVTTKNGIVRFILTPQPYHVTTNPQPQPQDIRVVMGYSVQKPMLGPDFTDFNACFQAGSSSTGPLSTNVDCIQPFNKDTFKIVYDKVFKVGFAASNQTGAVASYQHFNNNEYKLNIVRKINIKKYLSAKYTFNDNNNQPQKGKALYLFFMTTQAMGGTPPAGTHQPASIYLSTDYTYQDA